jgi:hypothetical protein
VAEPGDQPEATDASARWHVHLAEALDWNSADPLTSCGAFRSGSTHGRVRLPELLLARQRATDPHCRDNIADGLADCGRISFVENKGLVGASATTRWRLLVDRLASLSCAACQVPSCSRLAARTISGLPPKSSSAAAWCIAIAPSRNSLM